MTSMLAALRAGLLGVAVYAATANAIACRSPVGPTSVDVPEAPWGAASAGIWISSREMAGLPAAGPAWGSLERDARVGCGAPRLHDQNSQSDLCVLAKALVAARTGDPVLRQDVVTALEDVAGAGPYRGRALALGRQLPAYVIAADLVNLPIAAPDVHARLSATLRELRHAPTVGGPDNLIDCHERRPNNWGTHCGAARAAIAAYLQDGAELERVAQVFRGWLGDRTAYAGFEYGDLSWQCDPGRPVGINPPGCTRDGHSIDGVLPDDQRRGGTFGWPPTRENYVYEALQGALVQAVILHRAGYPAFEWEHRALLRAFRWLHAQAVFPAAGDDAWQPHVVNHFYGTSFPAAVPARPGKNMGWTDWTHGR